jgi:hypothetical protein
MMTLFPLTRREVLKAPLRPEMSTADTTSEARSHFGSCVSLMLGDFTSLNFPDIFVLPGSSPSRCVRNQDNMATFLIDESLFPRLKDKVVIITGEDRLS